MGAYRRSAIVVLLVLVLVPALALAAGQNRKKKQQTTDVKKLFNAGSYTEVVAAVQPDAAPPEEVYLAARSADALDRDAEASGLYDRLAGRSTNDVWKRIGASAKAVAAGQLDSAVREAAAAVEAEPGNLYAHYQHGHTLAYKRDFAGAAAAFRRAIEIDPTFAYAHYYAGMSFYRTREIGPMANHLQRFQELAPEAPERAQVASILRSVQG